MINEYKNKIRDEKMNQENCREAIKLITSNTESLDIVREATNLIESYRPYEVGHILLKCDTGHYLMMPFLKTIH